MKAKEIALECTEIGAKTALSMIPGGGALVTCIWDSVKANAAKKRMDEWKQLVEDRLSGIDATLEEIGNNELFTSAIMRATDSALRTAESKKREYLANIVRNSLCISVEESELMMFLDLIDRNTAWHLSILNYFRDPTQNGRNSANNYCMGAPITLLEKAFPDLCKDKDMIQKIIKDLQNDGLVGQGDFLFATMTPKGMIAPRTTAFGNKFLRYIEN